MKKTADCKNLDMINETFPTHGDKEIILPTMEAMKRGVTKGNLSLKTSRADSKRSTRGWGIVRVAFKRSHESLGRDPDRLITIGHQTRFN